MITTISTTPQPAAAPAAAARETNVSNPASIKRKDYSLCGFLRLKVATYILAWGCILALVCMEFRTGSMVSSSSRKKERDEYDQFFMQILQRQSRYLISSSNSYSGGGESACTTNVGVFPSSLFDIWKTAAGIARDQASPNATGTIADEMATPYGSRSISRIEPLDDHPHAGARFPNGTWGYVADVSAVRNHMIQRYLAEEEQAEGRGRGVRQDCTGGSYGAVPLSYQPLGKNASSDIVCSKPLTEGFEGKLGMSGFDRVVINSPEPKPNNNTTTNANGTTHRVLSPSEDVLSKGRILCAVYTHGGARFRLRGIRDTWAWRCDGFFAASTETIDDPNDEGFGAVDLPHLGDEGYNNMWQKTRSMIGYISDNYLNDFDYFFFSGDDTLLIVENLRRYLGALEARGFSGDADGTQDEHSVAKNDIPLFMGHKMRKTDVRKKKVVRGKNYRPPSAKQRELRRQRDGIFYVGGGSGYLLNRAAVERYVNTTFHTCRITDKVSAEDRYLSTCLHMAGIPLFDTTDMQGRARFHGLDPHYIARAKKRFDVDYVQAVHGERVKEDIISSQSVSFHLMKTPEAMKRAHAILYKSCPLGTELGDALAERYRDAAKLDDVASA